ncbi:hypothetical protein H0H81_001882 [Sphagnurus paluster]|uniref:Peptidase metallopeptidase domain-containing protein n=1 Tax=Sphagnurus paluster TaxID=117069 RepID=A0A9P7GIB5_9AGAR|nr:hypothetical protein H0H81_001882 [Sphagnurus paluster]
MSTTTTTTRDSVEGPCGLSPVFEPVVANDNDDHVGLYAVFGKDKLWPNGSVLTYSFFGGTKNQQAAVDSIAPEWTYYADLDFKRISDNSQDAVIRIGFDAGGGCWSAIGVDANDIQKDKLTMNLGWIANSAIVAPKDRGTILHEWGHAIGLLHEHQSPARGGNLTLKEDAVYTYYRTAPRNWSRDLIKSQIIDVYSTHNLSNFSKLDKKSVMMYFMPSSMNVERIPVDTNNNLSEMDKAYVVINYTRSVPHPKAKEWTLTKALTIAGVPDDELAQYLDREIDGVREEFSAWNIIQRQAEMDQAHLASRQFGLAHAPRGQAMFHEVDIVEGPCGLAPEIIEFNEANPGGAYPHAVFSKDKLWENETDITYSFFGGTENQKAAVESVAKEWTYYANLAFLAADDNAEDAMIRIGFNASEGSWSAVGKGAECIPKDRITMNLGWIADSPTVSANDRGTILHQWGHALGLIHEHYAQVDTLTLKPSEVYSYYRTTQGLSIELIKSQILDVYNTQNTSNFSQLDTKSIMTYFMPASMSLQGIPVNVNNELSDADKAYMVINYPRKTPHPKAKAWTLEKALATAGVPSDEFKNYLNRDIDGVRNEFDAWNTSQREKDTDTKPQTLPVASSSSTDKISSLLSELLDDEKQYAFNPKPTATKNFDPKAANAGIEHSIWSGIVSIFKHPAFQPIVSGVIDAVLTQRGLNPSPYPSAVQQGFDIRYTNPFTTVQRGVAAPYDAQQGLFSGIISITKNPIFQQLLSGIVSTALTQHSIQSPSAAPTAIEYGLLSDVETILDHPVVHQTLREVVDSVILQRGLNPAATAQYPEIQQGVWSGLLNILKNPTLHKVVATVVNSTLVQKGLKPAALPLTKQVEAPSPFVEQHGIFSSIGSLLNNPLVRQTLGGIVDAVLVQRGYNPKATAAQYPEVQQGIWSGLIDVLKNPTFQSVVGTVIQTTLAQHRLKPQTDDTFGAPTPEIQQSIFSSIFNIVDKPEFHQIVGSVIDAVFAQHGLNPLGPASSGVQHGLFSDSGPFLAHPAAEVVGVALTQHGLNARATGGDNPDVQQSIWSGIFGVLKSPVFQQAVGTVVESVLSRGINPSKAAPAETQQGLLSGFASLINHPLIRQTLSEVVGTVLTQRGLDNRAKAEMSPEVQQSIWSGITGLLGNSTFQAVVGKVVNGVLTQHGISISSVHASEGLTGIKNDLSAEPAVQHALSGLAADLTGSSKPYLEGSLARPNGNVYLNDFAARAHT